MAEPVDEFGIEPDLDQPVGARRGVGSAVPRSDALMTWCAAGVIVIAIIAVNQMAWAVA